MPTLETAGALITAEDASNYVKNHLDIKGCLQENVLAGFGSTIPCVEDVKTLFNDNSNAFIFDVEQLTTLLATRDQNDELPKYLMVLTGAKFQEGEDKNTATIVLAGVSQLENGKFYSMAIDKPALQCPPKFGLTEFPEIKK